MGMMSRIELQSPIYGGHRNAIDNIAEFATNIRIPESPNPRISKPMNLPNYESLNF